MCSFRSCLPLFHGCLNLVASLLLSAFIILMYYSLLNKFIYTQFSCMFSENKETSFCYIQALHFKVKFQPLFVSRNPVIYMQAISLLLVILWDILIFLSYLYVSLGSKYHYTA